MIIPEQEVTTKEVFQWQGLHLLHFQGSTCSQKVRLILGELELDWTSHPVSLIKHENATPWFLGINPRGVVPVLVHDGVIHVESNDIITYLDQQFAESGQSYFFEPDGDQAKEAQALLDLEDSLHTELRLMTIQFGPLRLKNEKQINDHENNGAFDEKREHEVRWWRDKARNGISESETRTAVRRFHEVFTQLDQRLENAQWLMGDRISIVDISWYVNLQRLERMGYPLSKHKHLEQFYRRLAARPAFREDAQHLGSRVGSFIFGISGLANWLKGRRLSEYLP